MNYTDFVDNLVSDYEDEYDLTDRMPLVLFETSENYRLRLEHMEDDLVVDEDGRVYETCESSRPLPGNLVWAATESYQLALGG